ncbi:MAG TPA: CheR family methyltransferase [Ktedonobacteraceae bacterium]|nr:CheR family methyltransferase [Ktedonobacteraceae bacterium]
MSEVELSPTSEALNKNPGDLVVIGSSAGGIEALSILVSNLPLDFPAPIVLAQHLDPNRPSTLDTILRRRTALPVELVGTRSHLESGKIYVVPSNRLVSIEDGHVIVQEDGTKRPRPRPSVDMLLSSAAQVYGDHLIAVILTGAGSDGAAGAVDVKNAGGTVIVQDPETARYPSMPLALPPAVIDFEVDIEQIGSLLYDLLNGVELPHIEGKTEDVLRIILERVSRQASIDFRPYKTTTILRRIGRRMTVTHRPTMREYADYLEAHPEEVGELVKAFLINVTQFFRDPEAFTYIRNEVLPRLIMQARERDRVLRLWAAGCASGEEPYSLAMLLTDQLGAELPEWSVKIFATDLDEAAINFARRGLYSETLLKSVPGEYRERFFEHFDQGYRISKTLRQMVIFGQQDLSRSAPFPRIDMVLCRNVLIYFTPELQEYVLNQFAFSLVPNGYLFLGKAETVRPTSSYFELVNKHWKVYRRTGNIVPMARRPGLAELNVRPLETHNPGNNLQVTSKKNIDQEVPHSLTELGQMRRFNELLLRFLPIGVVVIDRSYHVLSANNSARRLLGLRDTTNRQDFLHSVRGIPYLEVRTAIDTVFRERNTVTLSEIGLDNVMGGNGRFVSLSIALMHMDVNSQDLAAISVSDVTEQVQIRRQLEAAQAEQSQLMNEISTVNKRLNDVNKELLDSNEELQVANEELMLTQEELQATIEEFETTNEELQATNEELETTNEELQATNEELETSNEELQATNEELETTNDELRARSNELQELATMLESERMRLGEMVELAPFYILALRGPELVVEALSPGFEDLLEERGIPAQGRTLEEVAGFFREFEIPIMRLAREAYQLDAVRTTPRTLVHLPRGHNEYTDNYFAFTIVPSHDAVGRVTGVIIYAADQTLQRASEAEDEFQRLKLIFDNVDMVPLALYDAQSARLLMASPRYLDIASQLHGFKRNELIGRKWIELTVLSSRQEAEKLFKTVLESHTAVSLPEIRLKLAPREEETVWFYNLIPFLNMTREDIVDFVLVTAVEVTEQVRAREEMEQLNKLKDEFFSLASHELRSPLTSILGNTQLLERYVRRGETGAGREDIVRILDSIIHQIHRLSQFIDEMVDITRIGANMLELHTQENVDIVALTRGILETYSDTADHPLKFEAGEEAITGDWDQARLEQVLNNLVSNAIKYSPSGQPVVVGVERRNGEVVVWVQDEGRGISQEDQAHIFDRFYRTHNGSQASVEGLGLGLYIAHEILVRLGGRMWVESKPGEGSKFYFSLPLNQ